MNTLENVRTLVIEYLEESLACRSDLDNRIMVIAKSDILDRVYIAFFNLIADPAQSPESIIHILEQYRSGIDGFSTNKYLQTLVGFVCFEVLARRRPEVLNGPWETLLWVIVKYSSFSNTVIVSGLSIFKETIIVTLKMITEFISPELCPNPFLRLELIRYMSSFNCLDFDYDRDSFRDKVINTLVEICHNYTSLTADQVPNFSPIDLQFVMRDNNINMKYIMKNYDSGLKKSEIIAAFLMLTRNLALIEKEKHLRLNDQAVVHENYDDIGIEHQLSACLSFCGLIPIYISDKDLYYNDCLRKLVQAVGNDSLLMNYVMDTLDTITQVSFCFPDAEDSVNPQKDVLLHRFFKAHINRLPTFQYLQEIHGGCTPAVENRLRYFQKHKIFNNMVLYNDSDNDCEQYDSYESDYSCFVSEENDSEIDISD